MLLCRAIRKHEIKKSLVTIGVLLCGIGINNIHNIDLKNKLSYEGIVYQTKDNYFLFKSGLEKFYIYEKSHPYEIGDVLIIQGNKETLSFNKLESDFDFTSYLNDLGVYKELETIKIQTKFHNPIRLKSFRNYFLNKFDEDTRISVNAILFSDNEDNQLTNALANMHLGRLISSGGLYFYALMNFLIYFLTIKIKDKWAKLISLGMMSFYLILTFPKFSIIRLTIFVIARWINEYILKKKFSYLELISLIGIIMLIFDHHLAKQNSFNLGFFIPIYLYFINNSFRYCRKIKKRILSMILLYLFFIPFELCFYNSVSPLLIIYQSLLSPFLILFFYLSIFALYGLPIYSLINHYHKFLKIVINPFSYFRLELYGPNFSFIQLLIYYLILFTFIYYLSVKVRPFKNMSLFIFISSLLIYFLPFNKLYKNEVTFINVGQGDCCYISYKNFNAFIDTGGLKYKDVAKDCLIPFLKKKKVYDIDLVITTHDDYDHNGALTSLIKNFKVKKIMNNTNFMETSYGNLIFKNYNNHIFDDNDDNDKSLVIGFNLGKKDYLITGDAPIEIEKYIINEYSYIPCDILKVGHHGSKTSTCDEFIKFLKPEIGIISCGRNNYYGHPNQEVIDVLNKNNVKIRRTDLEGSVSFISYFC